MAWYAAVSNDKNKGFFRNSLDEAMGAAIAYWETEEDPVTYPVGWETMTTSERFDHINDPPYNYGFIAQQIDDFDSDALIIDTSVSAHSDLEALVARYGGDDVSRTENAWAFARTLADEFANEKNIIVKDTVGNELLIDVNSFFV